MHISKNIEISKIQYVLLFLTLGFCLVGAWFINGDGYPTGNPDEWARQLVTEFIYKNSRLPIGRESEIIIGSYGYSYALRPYLTAIIGSIFMKITAIFSTSDHALLFASRLCSVFSVTVCFYFACKLGNRLFIKSSSSTIFALVICYLPQVMYLGMYQNNDIFALMSIVMILFFLVSGQKEHWRTKYCVGVAIGLSLGLLSYYSIYGWLLIGGGVSIIFFACRYLFIRKREDSKDWIDFCFCFSFCRLVFYSKHDSSW